MHFWENWTFFYFELSRINLIYEYHLFIMNFHQIGVSLLAFYNLIRKRYSWLSAELIIVNQEWRNQFDSHVTYEQSNPWHIWTCLAPRISWFWRITPDMEQFDIRLTWRASLCASARQKYWLLNSSKLSLLNGNQITCSCKRS